MKTIQFELGCGVSIALPTETVAQRLIDSLRQRSQTQSPDTPKIGEYLAGQGGIYAGDIQDDDGVRYGLIFGTDDLGEHKWGPDGKRDLSEWDGLTNTNHLREDCPAAKIASDYEANGHADFYLPSRREMMIALANIPHWFTKNSWYWTSTPRSKRRAWAVHFVEGIALRFAHDNEFRVLPVRRFALDQCRTGDW